MLLSRRVPPTWAQTVRIALWPRRSWRRSLAYARLRLVRVRGRPRHLALGVAVGVFVAILPIPGFQLLAAAALAWVVRGHGGAAALATFAANPVTYPLIWIASYLLGATLLGTPVGNAARDLDALTNFVAHSMSPATAGAASPLVASLWPTLTTLFVGALPLALAAAAVTYAGVWRLLRRPRPVAVRTLPLHMHRPRSRRRSAGSRTQPAPRLKAAA